MKKLIIRLLIILTLLILINQVIRDYCKPTKQANYTLDSKTKELEADKKVNLVYVGSSRTHRHINPVIIDSICQNQSLHSYNLAIGGIVSPHNYYLTEDLIKNKSKNLKYIVLEITGLNDKLNRFDFNIFHYLYSWDNYRFSMNYAFHDETMSTDHKKLAYQQFSKGVVSHYANKNLLRILTFKYKKVAFPYQGHVQGYQSLDDASMVDPRNGLGRHNFLNTIDDNYDFMSSYNHFVSLKQTPLSTAHKIHLAKLIDLIELGKQHGIHIYIRLPLIEWSNNEYLESVPLYYALPTENRLDYSDSTWTSIANIEHRWDKGHLNGLAAKKISQEIGKCLSLQIQKLNEKQ